MTTPTFDLTTEEGRKNAFAKLAMHPELIPVFGPVIIVGKLLNWFTTSTPTAIEAQQQAAIALIKAGRDNNVDEMTITVEQTAGIRLGAEVDGIPIKCQIGKSGHMTIQVRYKADGTAEISRASGEGSPSKV